MTESAQEEPSPEDMRIPAGVWAISSVSLFMQISNSLVYSLFPVYLVNVLKISMSMLGIIEGIANATMAFTRFFSGAFSDWLGKRKPLTVAGYGMTMFARVAVPLVVTPFQIIALRFFERFGIGLRSASRDALIADYAKRPIVGASYGLRHSLDRCGAMLGPLLAILLMFLFANNFRAVFWVAVIPAIISVAVLIIFVKDAPVSPSKRARTRWRLSDVGQLGKPLWWFVILNVFMHLSFFSEAFLVIRASEAGLQVALIPLVLIAQNSVIATTAYPVGKFSDRIGRPRIVALGFMVMIVAHLVLSVATSVWLVLVGAVLWGFFRTARSVVNAIVADLAPAHLRGTAFGVHQMLQGMSGLIANIMAGYLWQNFGPEFTYRLAAVLGAVSLALFLLWVRAYGHVLKKRY